MINVKQSNWYIGKYGTQSEIGGTASGTASKVPTFSMNISEVDGTQSVDSSFFKSKLDIKGITFSTPLTGPTFSKKVGYEKSATGSKGFSASFAEVVKIKLTETKSVVITPTASNLLPFQQKFINKGLGNTTSTPLTSKSKMFFSKISDNIIKLDATDFQDFIAEVGKLPRNVVSGIIKARRVTVNDLVVTDINYTLKSGDIVRVGIVGHFINNTEGIAIVK